MPDQSVSKKNFPIWIRGIAFLIALLPLIHLSGAGFFVTLLLLAALLYFSRAFQQKRASAALYYLPVALSLPVLALGLLGDAAFLSVSLALFLFSLATLWEWSEYKSFSSFLGDLEKRIRTRLSKFLAGNIGFSLPTLLVAIAVSTAFFAWFADGVKEAKNYPWLSFASLVYATLSILALDIYYRSTEKQRKNCITTLVGFLSKPMLYADSCSRATKFPECNKKAEPQVRKGRGYKLTVDDYKALTEKYLDPGELENALRCNMLVLEKEGEKFCVEAPNVLPPAAILWNEKYKNIKRVEFIVADDTIETVSHEELKAYEELLISLLKSAKKRHDGDEELEVSFNDQLMVESYDVLELYEKVNKEYDRRLAQCSQAFIFNLTGGTSAMSAAITLVAIRGLAKGVYVKQASDYRKPLWRQVVEVKLDIYDLTGSVQEPGE